MATDAKTHAGYPVSQDPYVTDVHYSRTAPGTRAYFDGREHVLVGGVWHPRMTTAYALAERLQLMNDLKHAQAVASILYHALDDASTVVDPGQNEDYAYQAELKLGAGLLGIDRR